jgi:hypothetical protein
MCHPEGGNIINAKKTLHGKDLKANNIRNTEDIVKAMRNPGPGMTKFDEKILPAKEAKEIAEYVQDLQVNGGITAAMPEGAPAAPAFLGTVW